MHDLPESSPMDRCFDNYVRCHHHLSAARSIAWETRQILRDSNFVACESILSPRFPNVPNQIKSRKVSAVLICMVVIMSKVDVNWSDAFKGYLPSKNTFSNGSLYTCSYQFYLCSVDCVDGFRSRRNHRCDSHGSSCSPSCCIFKVPHCISNSYSRIV